MLGHSKTQPKARILNSAISAALSSLRHGEMIFLADAGLPLPMDRPSIQVIDIGVATGCPSIVDILPLMLAYGDIERVIVTWEMAEAYPEGRALVGSLVEADRISEIAYYPDEIACLPDRDENPLRARSLYRLRDRAKVIIQTGDYHPHGNVILVGGYTSPDVSMNRLLFGSSDHS